MNFQGRLLLCAAALFLLTSGVARADDLITPVTDQPASFAADQSASFVVDPSAAASPVACSACDADSDCACPTLPIFVPNLTPGFQFNASFLLLKPGADNLGWSTITTYLPIQSPQWAVQNLNPAYQPGFSVGAQYTIAGTGKDIRTNWEHLRTSDSSFVPVSNINTQWISPFNQTGPSTSEFYNQIGIFYLKAAQAQLNFAYDMVNLEGGQTVSVGPNTQFRFFAGLSWVRLQERLFTTFYNDTSVQPAPPATAIPDTSLQYITLNNTSTFTGVGPRVGLSTTQNLSGGFNFVGQLSGAILAGSMQPAQYMFQGVFQSRVDSEQISSNPVNQVVYASDAKLGLGYGRPFKCSILSFETGYKAAIFLNPFSTYETSTNVLPLNIGSLSTNSMRHTPSNFTLNGWYATCSVQW